MASQRDLNRAWSEWDRQKKMNNALFLLALT
jgi:hypothetical protein